MTNTQSMMRDMMDFHIPRWNELPEIELYMNQLIEYINRTLGVFFGRVGISPITKSMINNYVKARIVEAPVKKRYSRVNLAMIIVVYILKSCYSTEEVGKLIKLGTRLGDKRETYDRFCLAVEKAIKDVYSGEVHIINEKPAGRGAHYLMDNFALSFASKFYVMSVFLKHGALR